MGVMDILLLGSIGVYCLAVLFRKKKKGCTGNCGACGGCCGK